MTQEDVAKILDAGGDAASSLVEEIVSEINSAIEKRIEAEEEHFESDEYLQDYDASLNRRDVDIDSFEESEWDGKFLKLIRYLQKIGVDDNDIQDALVKSSGQVVEGDKNVIGKYELSSSESAYVSYGDLEVEVEIGKKKKLRMSAADWIELLLEHGPAATPGARGGWRDKLDLGYNGRRALEKGNVPDTDDVDVDVSDRTIDFVADYKTFYREVKSLIRSWKQAKKLGDPKIMKELLDEIKEEEEDKDPWGRNRLRWSLSASISAIHQERKEKKAALAAIGDSMGDMKDAAHEAWLMKQAESAKEVDAMAMVDEKRMEKWLAGAEEVAQIPKAFSAKGDTAYSYNTILAKKKGKTLFVNMTKYSKTTSRLQDALVDLAEKAGYEVVKKDGAYFRTSMPYKYKMGEHEELLKSSVLAGVDMEALKELLSEVFHEAWMHWSQSVGDDVAPERKAKWEENWVPYEQLDEPTKDMDREWAEEALKMIGPVLEPMGPPEEDEGMSLEVGDLPEAPEEVEVEDLDESLQEKEEGKALEMVTKVGSKYPNLSGLFIEEAMSQMIEAAGKAEGHCYATWMEGLKKLEEAQGVFNQAMNMSASESLPIEMKSELAELISQVYGLQSQVGAVMEELAEVDAGGPGPELEEEEEILEEEPAEEIE
jgi:hypothetical protein